MASSCATAHEEAVPPLHYGFTEQVIGQMTLYPLVAGEAILPGKLMGGSGGPLAQRCLAGCWCVSIPAEWFIAVPPDRVAITAVQPGELL